jgi:putative membrane protein
MKALTAAIATVAITLAAAPAMAQPIGPADKTFATKAAAGGEAEVQLGQLARKNAEAPQVREFGERMVSDHTRANQALQEIGKQQEMTLPTVPDAANRATLERLANLNGRAFDSAYMHDMVQDHETDIADFRREAETGRDPALKAFAQEYLPMLEQHLRMAKAAEGK